MYAKKCDRCGKLYEINTPILHEVKAHTNFGELSFYSLKFENHYSDYNLDLCPDCISDFIKWFEKVR